TDHATRFRQLHETGVLVLPNAWDAASARLIEAAGAQAIATTSAGVAWSLGHADGNHLPRELAADAVRRIVGVVSVPVTADIETGYGETITELRSTIEAIVGAGAVGINIEDAGAPLRATGEQAGRIRTVRETAESAGVPLFVNARIDAYLRQVGDPAARLDETVSRGLAYIDAGADGIFVPGLLDAETLRELAGRLPVPLNAMAGPGAPAVAELAELGVRRVSVGTAIAQAAYATARRGALELLTGGTYDSLVGGVDYGELNALLT
ncbi:MAG TPA: isocitrate lyase/phosphoenolpyruvate mutase family protein, partial [Pseudonocardia sp.]